MFDKLFKKIDQIKAEVFDQANKHMNDVSRSVRQGVGDALQGKKTEAFDKLTKRKRADKLNLPLDE